MEIRVRCDIFVKNDIFECGATAERQNAMLTKFELI